MEEQYLWPSSGIIPPVTPPPPVYAWRCHLIGGADGITILVVKGNEPNWFQRLMQQMFFGVRWEPIE